ncbi:MAG: hypothetical protein QOI04_95 [Verrucomicrobiota bacterium]|jgi:hypothetical protein
MIGRRVIGHLKNQQWIAFGIELVIVVLGVFIGIQVSNWNQERINSRQAANFAERLKADLREEDWGYQLLIAYNREVLANADRALATLEGKTTMSDEAMLVSAYRATQYKQKLRRRSTYDELISTGTIGLIRDPKLRDTAMRLYNIPTIDNTVREGMQSRYREAFRMSVPNDVQRALLAHCGDRYVDVGDYAAINGVLDYPCTTGLSEQAIDQAAKALRSEPNLAPLLRLRVSDIETRLTDLTNNNRNIVDNLRAIATEKP